jgi:hypothetical protein
MSIALSSDDKKVIERHIDVEPSVVEQNFNKVQFKKISSSKMFEIIEYVEHRKSNRSATGARTHDRSFGLLCIPTTI